MAKAAPAPATAEGEAPKKKGKLMIIIIAAVVVLALAGGGAFFFLSKKGDDEGAGHDAPAAKKKPAAHKVDPSKPPTFVPLEPFTVNLQQESGEQYLQAAIVLKVDDPHAGDQVKVFMPELRDRILLLLGSKKATEISSSEGREGLADDLKNEVNGILGTPGKVGKDGKRGEADGPVVKVLFTSFIVQ